MYTSHFALAGRGRGMLSKMTTLFRPLFCHDFGGSVKLLFSIQCQLSFQFLWQAGRDGEGGWSGIEFGCLLLLKSRFNCSKTHFALRLDASLVCTWCNVYSVWSENGSLFVFCIWKPPKRPNKRCLEAGINTPGRLLKCCLSSHWKVFNANIKFSVCVIMNVSWRRMREWRYNSTHY
jgi:hypothetical protein